MRSLYASRGCSNQHAWADLHGDDSDCDGVVLQKSGERVELAL
jgi:hypothetical protein